MISHITAAARLVGLAVLLHGTAAHAEEIRVLSSNGIKAVVDELAPQFEKATKHKVTTVFGLASALKTRIDGGERFDIAILTPPLLDDLIAKGTVAAASRSVVARVGLGLMIRAGARKPDVSTVDAFTRTLLDARSISYATAGASGVAFVATIEKLGIGAAIKAKARPAASGEEVSANITSGASDLAVLPVSEILPVRGAELGGLFPAEVQTYVLMAVGVSAKMQGSAAKDFVTFLMSPANSAVIRAKGMERVAAATYTVVPDWLKLPEGRPQLGNQHGDIAVSSAGEVFVSVQDPQAGLQVFSQDGAFLRNVPGAPSDFHGFVIRKQADGEFIYGATLRGQTIVKMTLEGAIVMTIGSSAIPDQYKVRNARSNQLALLLTGLDVAPNGDLYVTDGYASDYIHRFDKSGRYIASFGGKQAPYSFNTLHKLAIDTRFQPARLIACDRANNRVVHLSLDGAFLGVVAQNLLLPAAIAIDGDNAIVGELNGRVTVLDKAGAVVDRIGANTAQGIGTNKTPPAEWRQGLVLSPHGVALNLRGDLFVSEFSVFGRVHRFNRQ